MLTSIIITLSLFMMYWCHSLTSKGQSYVPHFKVVCSFIHSTNIDWVVTHWVNGVQPRDTWPLTVKQNKVWWTDRRANGQLPHHVTNAMAGACIRGCRSTTVGYLTQATGQEQWPTGNIKVLSAHSMSSRTRSVNEAKHRAQDQMMNIVTGFEIKRSPESVQMAIPLVTLHNPYCSVSLGGKYTS